jgi:transcriptional regulator with XRE-family HTH domain
VSGLSVGDNIRALREKKGISQSQLAERVGVSMHTIFRAEKNKTSLDSYLLIKLADFFNRSVDCILNGSANEGYTVTLSFVKSIEEVQSEMDINAHGAVSLADDGKVVVSHCGKLLSEEDKTEALSALSEKIDEALEIVKRREARKAEGGGSGR